MNTGIYAITSPSGRKYIGSAVNFANRWRTHRYNLRRGQHHSSALQHAYNKYGEAALVFEKLIICTKDDLLFYEQRALDAHNLNELYNIAPSAGNQLGFRHSDETKARYSEVRRGMRMPPRTAEHMQKIADAKRGKKQSVAFCENQSRMRKGVPKSAEHVAKVAAANRGKTRSAEVRAQMSAARANKPTAKTTSGFAGVSKYGDKWQARASIGGRRLYLGKYATPEAANAAIQAALKNGANPS